MNADPKTLPEIEEFLTRWPGAYEAFVKSEIDRHLVDAADDRDTIIDEVLYDTYWHVDRVDGRPTPIFGDRQSFSAVWDEELGDWVEWEAYNESHPGVKFEAKMARMTYGDLKRLILEAGEDGEVGANDAVAPKEPAGESGTSLDAQVDRYLSEYESEAKKAKQEGKDFRSLVKRIMQEAEGDEGIPADATGGKATVNDIDLESFANSVVRLIDNFDSLLEVRSTLMRRAENFLGKVYDEEVTKEFTRVMRDDHGIEPGKSAEDVSDEQFPAPPAARAGEGGSGPGAPPGA